MAATTGLSQGDFTRLRINDQNGDMVNILTLLGSAGNGGDITAVTGVGAIAVAVDGGSREISVDLSPYATAGSYKIGDLVDKQRSESKSDGLFQGLKWEGFCELKYNMFLEFPNRNN